jgi:hypothetical protein
MLFFKKRETFYKTFLFLSSTFKCLQGIDNKIF